jgi:V/A-type H+/Na+-transporting ATPase subunit A
MDALSSKEKLILLASKSIREDFLFQNAFDYVDAFTPLKKQYGILKSIILMYEEASKLVEMSEFEFKDLAEHEIIVKISKSKDIANDALEKYDELHKEIVEAMQSLATKYSQTN